ncbi:MAG: DUF917 domain-containing protein [Chloroflexi bacterium]|nr:DUF917 domain-containing protein [Chloroflexota bacterium]
MRELRESQLRDIVIGAGLLGAGGGGSTAEGMKLVDRVLEYGDAVKLALPQELAPATWGAVIAGVGSPRSSLNRVRSVSPTMALDLLGKNLGRDFSFVIPFELGAGNSLNPMLAAIQKDIPIVDGDPCGRAVPEIHMTTFYLGGIPVTPLALATEEKIQAVISAPEAYDAERVTRAITAELAGVSAIAAQAMSAEDLQRLVIPGTTTLVEQIGRAIRETKANRGDVAGVLADRFGGYLLGRGRVAKLAGETKGGFDFGTAEIDGELPVRIHFQNESMIAFRDGRLLAIVPDLICCIDSEGTPLTNADLKEGMETTYVGFPAQPPFRKPEVYALFTHILDQLGYKKGFRPIEQLAGK